MTEYAKPHLSKSNELYVPLPTVKVPSQLLMGSPRLSRFVDSAFEYLWEPNETLQRSADHITDLKGLNDQRRTELNQVKKELR